MAESTLGGGRKAPVDLNATVNFREGKPQLTLNGTAAVCVAIAPIATRS